MVRFPYLDLRSNRVLCRAIRRKLVAIGFRTGGERVNRSVGCYWRGRRTLLMPPMDRQVGFGSTARCILWEEQRGQSKLFVLLTIELSNT